MGGLVRRGLLTAPIQHRTPPPASTSLVAITNVRIFMGTSTLMKGSVMLKGSIIQAVLPNNTPPLPGYKVYDGKNGVLLPGLIDSHCHPGAIDDLEALTSYGVTTAIGMACLSYDICAPLYKQTGLTSFVSAGLAVFGTGSPHATLFSTPVEDTISSAAQAPQFVQNIFGNHSAFLKMVAEPGGPSQDILNALVEETHKAGYVSTTHASYLANYQQAITSKTDSIQHVPIDSPLTSALVQTIKEQKQFVTPTLNAFKYLLQIPGRPQDGSNYTNGEISTTMLFRAGVQILAGTDSFVSAALPPGYAIPFGVGLHDELGYLVQAGLTPLQALISATSLPAKLHSLPDRGSIAPNRRADLLLVDGNPLINIADTKKIKAVWVDGIQYQGTLA
ncbi:hypothetical protein BGZ63DRAFT_368600 [Mariannaea sp. PMI_226]|nr:hypothetical protein BGZ63DRAFT_368600 [Mariannaea sp. PMI_226]